MELQDTYHSYKSFDSSTAHQVARPASRAEVPVIDLSALDKGEPLGRVAAELRQACLGLGFAYLSNHGVSQGVIDRMYDASRRFFALSMEEKMKVKVNRFLRGYQEQGFNIHPGYSPDLKDFFELGMDRPLDDPDVASGLPFHGPNQWPTDHPWFREATEEYFETMQKLGHRVLRVIAVSLGLPEGFFEPFFKPPQAISRIYHYPPQPPTAPEDEFGVAPHTDFGAITLLTQDPIGGLEVKTRGGEWIGAPYIEGTIILNLGDLFRVWTNDLYVSNLHRVVNRTGKERYSIPMFFNPNYHALITCIETCQSKENPAKYKPVTAGAYYLNRLKRVQNVDIKPEA